MNYSKSVKNYSNYFKDNIFNTFFSENIAKGFSKI